jgi:hypothetical protein
MIDRFIGIDLTDPYSKRRRAITAVEFRPDGRGLHGELVQLPDLTWPAPPSWPRDASDLSSGTRVPDHWPVPGPQERLWVAIDGPQGLAGRRGATSRDCERETKAPGKTPHEYPQPERPFAGFVTGSVVLWSHLTGFEFPQALVDGLSNNGSDSNLRLCEIYPGVTWASLVPERRLPPKHEPEGKLARYALLRQLGVRLDEQRVRARDADDVLDEGLGALIAYGWKIGIASEYGTPPVQDPHTHTLREGYIRSLERDRLPAEVSFDLGEIERLTVQFEKRKAEQVSSIKDEGIIPANLGQIEAEVAAYAHPDAEVLCLCDNGGVWKNHHPWLTGLVPDVVLEAVDDGELIGLAPADADKHWKAYPTTLTLAKKRGFRGTDLSMDPGRSIFMFVRVVDTGC